MINFDNGPLSNWINNILNLGDIEKIKDAFNQGDISHFDYTTLSEKERARVEDVLKMLPYPYVMPLLLQQIFQDPDSKFGIGHLTGVSEAGGSGIEFSIGAFEASVVAAGLLSFIKANAKEMERITQEALDEEKNPIDVMLEKYIKSLKSGEISLDILHNFSLVQRTPLIATNFNLAGSALSEQALSATLLAVANQLSEITSNMLTKFAKSELQSLEHFREMDRLKMLREESTAERIKRNLLDDLSSGALKTSALSYALISALNLEGMAAAVQKLTIDPVQGTQVQKVDSITNQAVQSPIVESFNQIKDFLPQELQAPLELIAMAAAQVLACYFAIPIAITLIPASERSNTESINEFSVKSYALSLATIINSPDFEALLSRIISRSVRNPEALTPEQMKFYMAVLKITLLTNVLAALYKLEYKHITPEELITLIMQEGDLPPGLLGGIVALIREQKRNLPENIREEFIRNLASYFKNSVSLETLVNPAKAFLALCNPRFFREAQAAEAG